MMDVATFWKMIEGAREAANGDMEKQRELLVASLSKESNEDIIEFDRILRDMRDKAFCTNLIWEAGYFINCDGGDSVWMDFPPWIISHGQEVFEKAIENPDSLADVIDAEHRRDAVFETFSYVGSYAYQRKNGEDAEIPRARRRRPQFTGVIRDEEEWPQLFPALNAKLGSCDEWEDKYLDDYLNKGRFYKGHDDYSGR